MRTWNPPSNTHTLKLNGKLIHKGGEVPKGYDHPWVLETPAAVIEPVAPVLSPVEPERPSPSVFVPPVPVEGDCAKLEPVLDDKPAPKKRGRKPKAV